MTDTHNGHHRAVLRRIARLAMLERGLLPDFDDTVLAELSGIAVAAPFTNGERDLRHLLWSSIDNDDSLDLDQLTVAEQLPNGRVKIFVAVADVDALVKNKSAIDSHARHNTTSVYTAAEIFPMLPEKLSTNLTSLNLNEDRLAIVVEMTVRDDGAIDDEAVYAACVRNRAKLAYDSIAAWLEGLGSMPPALSLVEGLSDNLRLQDRIAQAMRSLRRSHGSLTLETIQTRPVFIDDDVSRLEVQKRNRAKDLIEDFMVAANGVTARYLALKQFPSLRRVVKTPKRWERIVEIAAEHGFELPDRPDAKGLNAFLAGRLKSDPLRFPDLSLSIIKLLGPGEYTAASPDGIGITGHFGLAVRDYGHSTAPNRRYPDLITQRLLKAALLNQPIPYEEEALEELARHCTTEENAAKKVERRVEKSAAALLLESRIGEKFNAIVTGASPKGTWVRLIDIPVEGRLTHGFEGLDVGHKVRVELLYTNVEQGFIDFKKSKHQ
jgi:VacB/RNase II family 3'-5' exoribonuclease